jgi:hypothetical protein
VVAVSGQHPAVAVMVSDRLLATATGHLLALVAL